MAYGAGRHVEAPVEIVIVARLQLLQLKGPRVIASIWYFNGDGLTRRSRFPLLTGGILQYQPSPRMRIHPTLSQRPVHGQVHSADV